MLETRKAWQWYDKGLMLERYGRRLTVALMRAVEEFDAGFKAREAFKMRKHREKMEAERDQRKNNEAQRWL